MLMMLLSPEEKQKHFQSKLFPVISIISGWILCTCTTNMEHRVSRLSTAPIHYLLLRPLGRT